ncbi:hypothetical protein ACET98_11040 [Aeromonas veronii]|uniref:hypothetical protein n=1 Tax=Aeromonas veronii TaxID=654 RepID=UPI0030D70D71
MADNREFAEQIGAAVANLGTNEALGCMARVMCWVATDTRARAGALDGIGAPAAAAGSVSW